MSREPAVVPDGGLAPAPTDVCRWRLDLSFDGTDFSGWARQPGLRTVQGILEDTLAMVWRVPVALTVAGRTDAGVHADGQVAHVDLPVEVEPHPGLVGRLARLLPPDVRVRSVTPAPPGFDARFSALRRHYLYRVSTAPWGPEPLRARDTLRWPRPLDVDAMNEAGRGLLGEHDFAAYCRPRAGATTVRELQRLEWSRAPCETGVLVARLAADAFCHSMVRSIVGALLAVGEGRRPVAWPAALLDTRERSSEVTVVAARGLRLTGVDYPDASDPSALAARATRTRRRRDER